MRVAVCLSGEARTYKDCAASLDNLLGGVQYDTFISTWEDPDLDQVHLRKLYSPAAMKIEKRVEAPEEFRSLYPMCYSIYAADVLRRKFAKQHNLNYDFVIRARFDAKFRADCNINFNKLNKNLLYFSPGYLKQATGQNFHKAWDKKSARVAKFKTIYKEDKLNNTKTAPKGSIQTINDQFAIASPENIEVYADVFLMIQNWIKQGKSPAAFPFAGPPSKNIHGHAPQDLFMYYLWIYNIRAQVSDKIRYTIERN